MKNVKSGHSAPIVCLDAGHYGKYNQSPAVKSYYESEMNWKLHNYLATELQAYGIQVKKTRSNQAKDLGLYDRGAASKGCDLFLSIHSNAVGSYVDETVDYVRVYHLYEDDGTDVDEKSKALAKLLAPVIADTMQVKQGGQTATRKASKDANGDGVMNDNYYGVLNGSRLVGTAGLILEHSFHTNTRATQWLLEDANLRKMAKAEAAVIAAYYGMTKAEEEPEHWYRIRESWDKPNTQKGAYKDLANAKANCPEGYTVFDWNGQAVYTNKPQPTTYTLALPILRKGDKGNTVKAMQMLLIANGYNCGPWGADGDFGTNTMEAVIHYQTEHNMPGDGIVGPDTMGSLLGL